MPIIFFAQSFDRCHVGVSSNSFYSHQKIDSRYNPIVNGYDEASREKTNKGGWKNLKSKSRNFSIIHGTCKDFRTHEDGREGGREGGCRKSGF